MSTNLRYACLAGLITLFPYLLNAQTDKQLLYRQLRGVTLPAPPASSSTRSFLATGNDKIDPALRMLASQSQTRSLGGFDEAAKALQVPVSDGLVAVSAAIEDGETVATVRRRVEAAGGEIDGVVGDSVFARIPPRSIAILGADPGIGYLNRQSISYATGEPSTYAGVELTKVSVLHQKGIRGRGVKVGVLDFGFGGYHELEAKGIVPTPVSAKFFGESKDWAVGVPHGAACTEIIHAMAPDAQIYLAMVGNGDGSATDGEIIAAANWLASQKVDIISFSGGGSDGPKDGRSSEDELVTKITAQGIVWVNAAGNEGNKHWSGVVKDADHDGWVDIGPQGEPFLIVEPQSDSVALLVNWNDWGADPSKPSSDQDLNAYLFACDPQTNKCEIVAGSENPQQGRGAPREFVGATAQKDKVYLLGLRMVHVTKEFNIHVFTLASAKLTPSVAGGSIGIPATSSSAISVAAIDVTTGKLEEYSSQGPTDDDRIKPDVAAPDNDISAGYSGKRFQGTSAACPHVSGMAALLKQMNPQADVPSLRKIVLASTRKMSAAVPSNETGYGIIDAGSASGNKVAGKGSSSQEQINIPESLGSQISTAKLEKLRALAGNTSRINPKLVVGKQTYRIGDGLKIGFKVQEDCFYLLLHRSSEGEYTVLAQSRGGGGKLVAGEQYIEPSGENKTLRITPPAGTEEIILICSMAETDLNDWRDGDGGVEIVSVSYAVVEE
jgi:hypothetical protein